MTLREISPQTFRRHRRPLRAFLIGHEAWFSTRDLRRLLNTDINDRLIGKLCADQHQRVLLRDGSSYFHEETVICESGLHVLLWMYCYHPENRLLRRWVSQEVLPALWDGKLRAA